MNLAKKLWMTTGTSSGTVPPHSGEYVDDVFSAYTYTGNGSTQTINNGIDLAGEGGLVWTKNRNNSFGNSGQSTSTSHFLWDFTIGKSLNSDSDYAGNSISNSFQPLSNGFLVNTSHPAWNASGGTQLQTSWTFRRAKRFFDIVMYTGNGATSRAIPHGLNCSPGMLVVKRTDAPGGWFVQHRSVSASNTLYLNQTSAQTSVGNGWGGTPMTSTTFYVGGTDTNQPGATYVAYILAHDTEV